jgi:hypothetical protein
LQEARVAETASLLKSIAGAADLEQAIAAALPYIDELFLSVLHANIQAALERDDKAGLQRLQAIDGLIQGLIRQAMPAGLQLAEEVIQADGLEKARALLEASADKIDEQTLGALLGAAQRLEQASEADLSAEMRELHRLALRLSMQAKLGGAGPAASPTPAH